jgi:uncharacterized protein (TIGR04255 family)
MKVDLLPKRLGKEPLLDALFECRFEVPFSLTAFLPGLVHQKLNGRDLQQLPHFNIPSEIRNTDVNLKFVPLISVALDKYTILIGDQSLSVSCHMPYQGWKDFREIILRLLNVIADSEIQASIVRYSLKYIDLIETSLIDNKEKLVELELKVGGYDSANRSYHVRMDILEDGFVNIIQVNSGSKIVMLNTNSEREGIVVDIDTIKEIAPSQISEAVESFSDELENIHNVSKKMFFQCITPYCLEQLEPEYE